VQYDQFGHGGASTSQSNSFKVKTLGQPNTCREETNILQEEPVLLSSYRRDPALPIPHKEEVLPKQYSKAFNSEKI